MTILARVAILAVLAAYAALGQTTFEAATVKPAGAARIRPLAGGPGTNSPGELRGAATLKTLLMRAYDLKDYQIVGPAWMDTERYEIVAKVPDGADRATVAQMLQGLLAERFRLEVRRETREHMIYSLTVAKNGPKLRESAAKEEDAGAPDAAPPRPVAPKLTRGADGLPDLQSGSDVSRTYVIVLGGSDGVVYKMWARRESMALLADRLSATLNQAVIDRTGLTQRYDFTLTWSVESAGGVIPRTGPPPDQIESHSTPVLTDPGLSVFNAVREQLGLTLQPRKGPIETLVVTRAEKTPIGN